MSTNVIMAELATAAIVVSIWSFLYRDNAAFRVGQAVVVGIFSAHQLLGSITNIIRYDITPLATDATMIIALVWGALFYTYLSDKYRYIYRALLIFLLAADFGSRLVGNMWQFHYNVWYNAANILKSPMLVVNVIVAATTFVYYIYWKRFQDAFGQTLWLRGTRSLYRYIGGIFFGWIVGMWFLSNITNDIDLSTKIMEGFGAGGVGMYIVYLSLIVVIIDLVYSKVYKVKPIVAPVMEKP